MREDGASAAFAFWKGAKERQDALAKINRQRQNRPKLNDDSVHFPEAVMKVDMQQRFTNAQVCGRAHGKKFGQPFDDSEKDRQQVFVHVLKSRIVKPLNRHSVK